MGERAARQLSTAMRSGFHTVRHFQSRVCPIGNFIL